MSTKTSIKDKSNINRRNSSASVILDKNSQDTSKNEQISTPTLKKDKSYVNMNRRLNAASVILDKTS